MNRDLLGFDKGNFYSDIPIIDADRYDPLENVRRDEKGAYIALEDGRKLRLPSPLNMQVELVAEDEEDLVALDY